MDGPVTDQRAGAQGRQVVSPCLLEDGRLPGAQMMSKPLCARWLVSGKAAAAADMPGGLGVSVAAVGSPNFVRCEMPITVSPRRRWRAGFPGW
jgi:hypothetical protein